MIFATYFAPLRLNKQSQRWRRVIVGLEDMGRSRKRRTFVGLRYRSEGVVLSSCDGLRPRGPAANSLI